MPSRPLPRETDWSIRPAAGAAHADAGPQHKLEAEEQAKRDQENEARFAIGEKPRECFLQSACFSFPFSWLEDTVCADLGPWGDDFSEGRILG